MSVPEWVTLSKGEQIVWSGTPSLLLAAGSLFSGLLVAITGIVLYGILLIANVNVEFPWVALVLIPIGLLVMGYAYVRHRSTRYAITTNEVYRKDGLFSRQVTSLRLDRVQNTSFEQSFLERLLSYGDVRIDTAGTGGTEIIFEAVSNPQKVSSLLTEQFKDTSRP